MIRPEWQNLSGRWEFELPKSDPVDPLSSQIVVSFPVESFLSGVAKRVEPDDKMHCRCTFRLPERWRDRNVVLHFGAVDQHAVVTVNGARVGDHSGGYRPFSIGITGALQPGPEQ